MSWSCRARAGSLLGWVRLGPWGLTAPLLYCEVSGLLHMGFLTTRRPQGSWPAHVVAKGFRNRYSSKQGRLCIAFMILPEKSPLLPLFVATVTRTHSGSRGGDTDITSCWVEGQSHLICKHWDGGHCNNFGKCNCSLPAIFLNHHLNPILTGFGHLFSRG